MSKKVTRGLAIKPSPSSDVESYELYWGAAPHDFDYDGPHVNVGLPPLREVNGEQQHVVNLDQIPEVAALPEGNYDFAVVAVDDVGNKSDFVEAENVPLDLTPPEPPAAVSVFNS